MSAGCYAESIRRLLLSEGGYVNHPSDPGGPTNFGVTLTDYRRYKKPGATAADVRAMKVDEAKAIYRSKYWNAIRADDLPAGVDYCLFDYAVNSGTGRAPKVLQRVLGVAVSGRVDDATVRAAAKVDAKKLITSICGERLRFMRGLKTWPVFGKGWARRVAEVQAAALAMAAHVAVQAPVGLMSPSIAPDSLPVADPTPSAGKGAVPEPTKTIATATKGAPSGLVGLAIAVRDWIVENPVETALIAAAAVVVIYGVVKLIRHVHAKRQDAAVPYTLVTA